MPAARSIPLLLVTSEGAVIEEHHLTVSPYTIGRDPRSDLVIDHPSVALHELRLIQKGALQWAAIAANRADWGGAPHLNGAPLLGVRILTPADELSVGPLTLRFEHLQTQALSLAPLAPALALSPVPLNKPSRMLLLADAGANLASVGSPLVAARRGADFLVLGLQLRGAQIIELQGGKAQLLSHRGAHFAAPSRIAVDRAIKTHEVLTTETREGPLLIAPLGAPSEGVLVGLGSSAFDEADAIFALAMGRTLGAALVSAAQKGQLQAEHRRALAAASAMTHSEEQRSGFGQIVGASGPMLRLNATISQIAPTERPVLILGEAGTGKQLVARAIHRRSAHAKGPFIVIDCEVSTSAESALFSERGLVELARGGTLLLQEIDALGLDAQARLEAHLRAPQTPPTTRVIATSSAGIEEAARTGRFLDRLHARLGRHRIEVPPLRDRREDLPALVRYRFDASNSKQLKPPTAAFLTALNAHSFPGNVAELLELVTAAIRSAAPGEALDARHLPPRFAAERETET